MILEGIRCCNKYIWFLMVDFKVIFLTKDFFWFSISFLFFSLSVLLWLSIHSSWIRLHSSEWEWTTLFFPSNIVYENGWHQIQKRTSYVSSLHHSYGSWYERVVPSKFFFSVSKVSYFLWGDTMDLSRYNHTYCIQITRS